MMLSMLWDAIFGHRWAAKDNLGLGESYRDGRNVKRYGTSSKKSRTRYLS